MHAWRWNPARLDELIAEADQLGVASRWLCGQAANALDLADRFDAILLLDIDQATMAGRMQRRGHRRRRAAADRADDAAASPMAAAPRTRRTGPANRSVAQLGRPYPTDPTHHAELPKHHPRHERRQQGPNAVRAAARSPGGPALSWTQPPN